MSPRMLLDRVGDRIRALSPRDRRAVMVGAAILVPALLWIGVVRPYTGALADMSERAASERALLERERELLREAPRLPDRIEAARRALDRWDARFVRSANLALAEAEVTELLEDIARESRVLLQEARGMTPSPQESAPVGLRPIRLSVRGESDFEGVLRFVHGMERDPLLLRIVGLQVEPAAERSGGGGQEQQGRAANRSGVMSFMVIVEAFAPEGPLGADAIEGGDEQ